jgi:hypothetical protein
MNQLNALSNRVEYYGRQQKGRAHFTRLSLTTDDFGFQRRRSSTL